MTHFPASAATASCLRKQRFPRSRWLRSLLVLALLGTGLLANCGARGSQAPANPFDQVVEHRLKNGLKVLLLKESRAPIISLQVWYRVGSRNEALGKTGISHLCEHLMFKGTEKYGPKYFSQEVQKAGGTDNAFTGRDYTAYFETGPKTELKKWLGMEADRMRGSKVSEEDFNLEKHVVLEERRMRTEDDPTSFMQEAAMAATFEAHPYQWPVIGWFNDIESISWGDYRAHYDRFYEPNNCTLVVVGDLDPKEAILAIEETFGQLPAGPEPPKVTAKEPKQVGERRVLVRREAQLPVILLSYHTPNWQNDDAYALELLSAVMSEGRSSRLYHSLVYEQKLALEVGTDYDLGTANPYVFMVYGQPLPGKTSEQVEAALEAEIKRLQAEPVGEKELQKAKNQLTANFYLALDSLFYRGMLLGRLDTVATWTLIKDFIPKIQKVTSEDLQRVARQYLVPDNRTVGVLVPIPTAKPKMERFQPGGQVQ